MTDANMFKTVDSDGYIVLSKEEYSKLFSSCISMLKKVTDIDAQEITIIEGEPLRYKSKGVLIPDMEDSVWTAETFNFFLEHLAQEYIPNVVPSGSKRINPNFFDLLVLSEGKYYKDFAVSARGKVLRVHAVSLYEGSRNTRTKYCFTIRVVPQDMPVYSDLNLPEAFQKATTLKSGLVLISGHTASGKALTANTKIPTPYGIVELKDLNVGDVVFDRNGNQTLVSGVYPQGVQDVYSVKLEDGRVVLCNLEHLWTYYNDNGELETSPLSEILKKDYKGLKIPTNKPVTYALKKDLPKVNHFDDVVIENLLKDYVYGTLEQREDLLKVLLNNYGEISHNERVSVLVSELVKEDVLNLIRSLGLIVTEEKDTFGTHLEIHCSQDILLGCNIVSDYLEVFESKGYHRISINEIKPLGYAEEQICIKVENNEHLFLANDFVVTHNTTTVASLINAINTNPSMRRSILTIEDPVEFVHNPAQAVILQRAIGINTESYTEATSNAVRENVDTVVIGELREPEAMDNAIRLAEMGKLVFATIHSNSPSDVIERIVAEFSGDLQESIRSRLFETVVGVIHQKLEILVDDKTGVERQIPSSSGFLITNSIQRAEFRKNRTRQGVNSIVNEKEFGFSYLDSYNELVKKGVIQDTPANKAKLCPK